MEKNRKRQAQVASSCGGGTSRRTEATLISGRCSASEMSLLSSAEKNTEKSPEERRFLLPPQPARGLPETPLTAPNYLFGSIESRRQSVVPCLLFNSPVSEPSTTPESSNAPTPSSGSESAARSSTSTSALFSRSPGKTVHWAPELVRVDSSPSSLIVSAKRPFPKHMSKASGPPRKSMRDEVDVLSARPVSNVAMAAVEQSSGRSDDSLAPRSLCGYAQSNVDVARLWVTVFGFEPSQSAEVVQFFSRIGTVVTYRIPASCNWMHIRFANEIHAQQALSRSAILFKDSVRLGVLPMDPNELKKLGYEMSDEAPRLPGVTTPLSGSPRRLRTFRNCAVRDSWQSNGENSTPTSPLDVRYISSGATSPAGPWRDSPDVSRDVLNASRSGFNILRNSAPDEYYRIDSDTSFSTGAKQQKFTEWLWSFVS